MKKVLSTVAALGLVAGLASTASAVEFKMSGNYLVEGAYLSDAYGTGIALDETPGTDNPSDAYWLHTFEMKPTMKVNDKISMMGVVRLADDTFWGNQAGGDTEGLSGTNDVYVHHLYMDYASDIGKIRVGRTPAGPFGTSYRDLDSRADRVMLWPSFLAAKPWSTLFYIQKNTDNFQQAADVTKTDVDSDTYVARLYYKTDSIDSGIHYGYMNNKTSTYATTAPFAINGDNDDQKQELTVYGKYKMDNYFLNAELTHFFGSKKTYSSTTTLLTSDRDYDSWAGMLEVGAKIDALTPSLMYFYAQGQDINNRAAMGGDMENALGTAGTGEMFSPLYILTGRHTGMLNNDIFSGSTTDMSLAGVHAVVASVDYAASDRLTLHGAIGWAKADEKIYGTYSTPTASLDDEYGWEYNVGAAYKLLDNLTYEAHFGYLDTGDYFNGDSTTDITENVYILTHSLTMTF